MRIVLPLLAVALLALPSSLAVTDETYVYVGGTHAQYPAGVPLKGICSVTTTPYAPSPIAEGGVCSIPVTAGETVHLAAVDEVLGSNVQFSVRFMTVTIVNENIYENVRCAPPIEATGTFTGTVPDGCNAVDVLFYVGSTTGTLHVW